MYLRCYKSTLTVPRVNNFKYLLSSADSFSLESCDFLNLLLEHHDSLTPLESISAARILENVKDDHARVQKAKGLLVDNIRTKLYTLSEINQLCRVTDGVITYKLVNKAYISDFISRFDKLVLDVTQDNIAPICKSLKNLHLAGFNVNSATRKLISHAINRKITTKLNDESIHSLIDTTHTLDIDHKPFNRNIMQLIKDRLSRGDLSTSVAAGIIQVCRDRMVNTLLMEKIIENWEEIPFEDSIKCLMSCNRKVNNIERFNLAISNKLYSLRMETRLRVLTSYARLQYRPKEIELLIDQVEEDLFELSDIKEFTQLVYDLYLLNVHSSSIISECLKYLRGMGMLNQDLVKLAPKVLTSLTYFNGGESSIYNSILMELIRFENQLEMDSIRELVLLKYLFKIKNIEISASAENFLETLENKAQFNTNSSRIEMEIGKAVTKLSYNFYEKVNIGPLAIDFVAPVEHPNIPPNLETLKEKGIAILIDQHYHKSRERTSRSLLYEYVISGCGYRLINICVEDWSSILEDRLKYLSCALKL